MSSKYTTEEFKTLKNLCATGDLKGIKKIVKEYKFYNNSCMAIACKHGHSHVALWLHGNTSNINNYRNYEQAFRNSCETHNTEACKWLLKVDPMLKISTDFKALCYICESGNHELMSLILKFQPNVDKPLLTLSFYLACLKGHYEICTYLFENYPDIDLTYNNTLIEHLIKENNIDVLKWLNCLKPGCIKCENSVLIDKMLEKQYEFMHFICDMCKLDVCINSDHMLKYTFENKIYEETEWIFQKSPHQNITERYIWACKKNYLLFVKCVHALNPKYNLSASGNIILRAAALNGHDNIELCNWIYEHTLTIDLSVCNEQLLREAVHSKNINICNWIFEKNPKTDIGVLKGKLFRQLCRDNNNLDMILCLYNYDNSIIESVNESYYKHIPKKSHQIIETITKLHNDYMTNKKIKEEADYYNKINDEIAQREQDEIAHTHKINNDNMLKQIDMIIEGLNEQYYNIPQHFDKTNDIVLPISCNEEEYNRINPPTNVKGPPASPYNNKPPGFEYTVELNTDATPYIPNKQKLDMAIKTYNNTISTSTHSHSINTRRRIVSPYKNNTRLHRNVAPIHNVPSSVPTYSMAQNYITKPHF